jgi:type IV secretory pathway VirB9-like protein
MKNRQQSLKKSFSGVQGQFFQKASLVAAGKSLAIILILIVMANWIGAGLYGQLKTAKMVCTFDDKDRSFIDTVYCREKYETTFILPVGKAIKKAVTGDPDEWEIIGNYGGRIVSVKPLPAADQTSLTIVTQCMKVYKFNIINIKIIEKPEFDVIAIVEIRDKNTSMEVIKKDDSLEAEGKLLDEEAHLTDIREIENKKEEILINLDYDYEFERKYFDIENVYDDGIFTYIIAPDNRECPAVYIMKKKNKKDELEPIKYVVKPGRIVVHRIIGDEEKMVLRSGSGKDKKESIISRKKKRGKK